MRRWLLGVRLVHPVEHQWSLHTHIQDGLRALVLHKEIGQRHPRSILDSKAWWQVDSGGPSRQGLACCRARQVVSHVRATAGRWLVGLEQEVGARKHLQSIAPRCAVPGTLALTSLKSSVTISTTGTTHPNTFELRSRRYAHKWSAPNQYGIRKILNYH